MKRVFLIYFLFSAGVLANAEKTHLGKQLFNDVSLSKNGTQSCATCHNIDHSFIDLRNNQTSATPNAPAAVALGQDGKSLGDINVPAITYASFVPDFHFDQEDGDGLYKGGLFLDGRAKNIIEQAKQPFLNPIEMQNTTEGVVSVVKKKYSKQFQKIYGEAVFATTDSAFNAIADAISTFEKTETFASFDSKFDQYLQGKIALSEQEKLGLELFKDEEKGNCAACHPVPEKEQSRSEQLFTDFSYDNLGVPKNILVRHHNQKPENFVDNGLFNNPNVNDESLKGAFRVSSLRNIAVSSPYMHNGVFQNLKTVVEFYNSRDVLGAKNPETQKPWRMAEIDATKNTEELGDLKLNDDNIDAIVAFLQTLTDKRYQHLQ